MNKTNSTSKRRTNVADARYLQSERLINEVLNIALSNRRINIRPMEICKTADITRPTFYAHCTSSDEALRKYENRLLQKFDLRLAGKVPKPEVVYSILLCFIQNESGYFEATLPNHDYWLLYELYHRINDHMNLDNPSDESFKCDSCRLTAIIADWFQQDNLSRAALPARVCDMLKVDLVTS